MYTSFFNRNKLYESFFQEQSDIKTMTFTVEKIGRKWIQAISVFKDWELSWSVELNDISREWKVGGKYTVDATTDIQESRYGKKRYAFPVSSEDIQDIKKQQQIEKARKEVDRWLGYIESNLNDYWYKKGALNVQTYASQLPDDEKQEALQKLESLKTKFRQLQNSDEKVIPEINRWLGYIKDNMKKYWYTKGEDNVLELAKKIGQESEYVKILKDLKNEFKSLQAPKETKSKKDYLNISYHPDSYQIGKTLYRKEKDIWITITDIKKEYYGDDAMSFGGNQDGYVVKAYYALAKEADIEKEKEKQTKDSEYRKKVNNLEKYFLKGRGKYKNKVSFSDVGEIYHIKNKGHNIYGGGIAYGISKNSLWEIRNNGMDGDDWSRNNFSTGGAGAIAIEFSYDEKIADIIREICFKGIN